MTHPLDPLTPDEITAAVAAVRAHGHLGDGAWFSTVTIDDARRPGVSGRRARVVAVPGPKAALVEATVDLGTGEVAGWVDHDGVRPPLGFGESLVTILAVREHPAFVAALAARGIDDVSKVQVDPWPAGNFGNQAEEGRRVAHCLPYYRENEGDNGYARPIEGLQALVDMATGEVLEVIDTGPVPMPTDPGSYFPEDHPARPGLAPLVISQPDGVGFEIDGHELSWQGWSLHVSLDPLEGIVLRDVAYRGRSVLRRASICEMVVPYGDPRPGHGWQNAFDVGEWGLGRLANSLTLGCDCLGEIRYLDAVVAGENGEANTMTHAICLHEEDVGIGWKHLDYVGGRTEVRRRRRMVVSSISTVGNYDYGFYWYMYQDGSLELEVKLTGILSTAAVADGATDPASPLVAPGVAAPVHQHLFCARLDPAVDGPVNEVEEVDVVPLPPGDGNPWSNGFAPAATRLASERDAQRSADPARSRTWRILNPAVRNGLGQPVAYRLIPRATPTLLAGEDASVTARAAFATRNLWVTPYAPDQRRAAGDFPSQHPGGAGLPAWTAADRSLVGTEVVLWHTFGLTHVPRPEDWPVMPVETTGFMLVPSGFFDRNPALDVPPPEHCDG